MQEFNGIICKGYGFASLAIATQMPELVKYDVNLANCHPGTLNILLDEPLFVRRWDIQTQPIPSVGPLKEGERIDLLRIGFLYEGRTIAAWLYSPHGSPHRSNPFLIEILAPRLNVKIGDLCAFEIQHQIRRATWTIVG
jgi:hypothetical protein